MPSFRGYVDSKRRAISDGGIVTVRKFVSLGVEVHVPFRLTKLWPPKLLTVSRCLYYKYGRDSLCKRVDIVLNECRGLTLSVVYVRVFQAWTRLCVSACWHRLIAMIVLDSCFVCTCFPSMGSTLYECV